MVAVQVCAKHHVSISQHLPVDGELGLSAVGVSSLGETTRPAAFLLSWSLVCLHWWFVRGNVCVCKSFTTFCAVISWSCCFFYWHVIWEPQLSAELLNFTPIRLLLLFQTVRLKIEGSIYKFWEQWNCGLLIKFRLWRGLHFWVTVSCVFSFFNNVDVWNTHTGFLHETRAVASQLRAGDEEKLKESKQQTKLIFTLLFAPIVASSFFSSQMCVSVCVSTISVMRAEPRAAVPADWSRIDQQSVGDYVHWSDRRGLWFDSVFCDFRGRRSRVQQISGDAACQSWAVQRAAVSLSTAHSKHSVSCNTWTDVPWVHVKVHKYCSSVVK